MQYFYAHTNAACRNAYNERITNAALASGNTNAVCGNANDASITNTAAHASDLNVPVQYAGTNTTHALRMQHMHAAFENAYNCSTRTQLMQVLGMQRMQSYVPMQHVGK